jgi:hypothetical protein
MVANRLAKMFLPTLREDQLPAYLASESVSRSTKMIIRAGLAYPVFSCKIVCCLLE